MMVIYIITNSGKLNVKLIEYSELQAHISPNQMFSFAYYRTGGEDLSQEAEAGGSARSAVAMAPAGCHQQQRRGAGQQLRREESHGSPRQRPSHAHGAAADGAGELRS